MLVPVFYEQRLRTADARYMVGLPSQAWTWAKIPPPYPNDVWTS